jgi:tetratricopeptide (TPR) repeat protein
MLLGPLSREETAELAGQLARSGSDAATLATLADRLWQMSHGHPFMIVETMTAIAQRAPATPSELSLPERVRDVIAGRLERLGERARTLASVAAVIGHAFEFPLLRDASGLDEDQVADALEELVRRRILRVADERFDFTHDRIREVLISQLLAPRRRLLHRQIAEALDAATASASERPWAALAAHCLEASLWDKAARYAREAGRTASNQFAEREAAAWFEQALAAVARLPADRAALELEVDIRIEMRNSLVQLADFARLRTCLDAAVEAARSLDDPRRLAWASLFAGQFRWWTDEGADAATFAAYAAAIGAGTDDPGIEFTAALYAGFAWHNAGEYGKAIEIHTRALGLIEARSLRGRQSHYSFPLPSVHAHLARSFADLGEFERGTRHAEDAVRLAEQTGHRLNLIIALWSLGYVLRIKGEYAEAIVALERSAGLRLGGVLDTAAIGTLGYTYALTGRVTEGIAVLEEQMARVELRSWNLFRARGLTSLAHAYALAGRVDDAARLVADALAGARRRGERGMEAAALYVRGEVEAAREPADARAAGDEFAAALALATTLGMQPLVAQCHLALGRVLGPLNAPRADAHRQRAAAMSRDLGMSFPARPAEPTPAG